MVKINLNKKKKNGNDDDEDDDDNNWNKIINISIKYII